MLAATEVGQPCTMLLALRGACAILLILLISGCSGPGGIVRDGPPAPGQIPDLAKIEEPEPRHEPRSRYGNPTSYQQFGRTYVVRDSSQGYRARGIASWYGTKFHGRRTSSGEPYDMYKMTAAHRTLPLPSYVRVTNLRNGQSVVVRVNDRGPFKDDRIIDLSYAAAHRLGMLSHGTAPVEVEAITPGTPAEPTPAPPNAEIYLQFGAFADKANAERLAADMRAAGLTPVEVAAARARGQRLHRVRIGPLTTVDAADRTQRKASELGFGRADVVIDDRWESDS